jgi:hypothetical protein
MPFTPATLAVLIAASGGPEGGVDPDVALAQQLAQQELGRNADPSARESILVGLSNGMSPSGVRAALRSSYERFVSDNFVAGQNSDTFRRLSASASVEGLSASSAQIAECIAAYRLLLGREPETGGFASFLASLHTRSLPAAVRDILASPEATQYFEPDPPPPLTVAVQAVSALAAEVLHAAATDVALGTLRTLNRTVNELAGRIVEMEQRIDKFIEVVLLRLDASPHGD